MVQTELTVGFENGIHLAPANKIANAAEKFESTIFFKTDFMQINAKSIISLVSGTFRKGDTLLCECNGADEKEALEKMKELLTEWIQI